MTTKRMNELHLRDCFRKNHLHEHSAMVWLPVEELHNLDWAEADWPVIRKFQKRFDKTRA